MQESRHYQFNIKVRTAGRNELSNFQQMIEVGFAILSFAFLLGMLFRGEVGGG
jgi:hypothetical protein